MYHDAAGVNFNVNVRDTLEIVYWTNALQRESASVYPGSFVSCLILHNLVIFCPKPFCEGTSFNCARQV